MIASSSSYRIPIRYSFLLDIVFYLFLSIGFGKNACNYSCKNTFIDIEVVSLLRSKLIIF